MTEILVPRYARQMMGTIGRLLYDTRPMTLWERDTATLPGLFQKMRRRYRDFAEKEIAPLALDADREPACLDPRALFIKAGRLGFMTEFLPTPMGSMNPRALLHPLLIPAALKAEEFCTACSGVGLAVLAHDLGIGPLFVSGDVKAIFGWMRKIYGEIKNGEPAMAAFAITEPGAGSDVEDTDGALSAKLSCSASKVQGGWRITGRKCFITDGAVARWITLFAAQKGEGLDSWTCFLLDNSMPGLSVGRKERKMGQRAADASELILEDVFVVDERVIGGLGAGWAINRNVLNFSRPVVGAIALGIARGAFEQALSFCNKTQLNGRPLTAYQDVQLTLADMMLKVSAMRATVWQAVKYRLPFQAAGATAKVFCSDTAWAVCNAAMELLGDHGYLHIHKVEKAARDARLTQIYEGTNQINRLAIFESQLGAEFLINE